MDPMGYFVAFVLLLAIAYLAYSLITTSKKLKKYAPIMSVERAVHELRKKQAELTEQTHTLSSLKNELTHSIMLLEEEDFLHETGFYKSHYNFENLTNFESKLQQIRDQQKEMVRNKEAAYGMIDWTVDGNKRKGQKMINNHVKLMLRAFNGECDAAVSKVNYKNIVTLEARIRKACETLNKVSEDKHVIIATDYIDLKIQELRLVHEYQEKKQEEKEEQRRIKEEMREEERARRELEKAKEDAEKEERRYEQALEKAKQEVALATGDKQAKLQDKIAELQRQLDEAHEKKERALSRAQMTKSGHVYVISNIGSFGEEIYKIGMTRRLEPMDRVKELGDASVPFSFDVHAMIFTEDAPALENQLHQKFTHRRVNRVNERKEFFNVGIDEIEAVVTDHHGEFHLTKLAEAEEFRKTLAMSDEIVEDLTAEMVV